MLMRLGAVETWTAVLGFANVTSQGLLAGGLFIVLAGAVPTFRALPVETWLRVHRGLDSSIKRFMPVITLVALLTAVALLALPQNPLALWLTGAGVASLVVGIAVTTRLNHPINVAVARHTSGEAPLERSALAGMRARWITGHRYRTWLAVLGLVCFAAAQAA
ncbi:anthrone oxygenase family protein [Streptomonospora nanhaiensis]|uniref:anthrone oxygenase family protein n=1 Tax=Streptomonospora nanhaiensis TaxID=1323731 RepID=UPI001C3850C1|nr:DUF1772 domain-containing protein [Streptomonospora nanhaiensis]MBV2365255.1 DUF1772 domain-containing protein [Streptomonospora nanhaiensis]